MDIANKTVKVKTWEKMADEYGFDKYGGIRIKHNSFSKWREYDLPENRIITLDENCGWDGWFFTPEMIEQIIEPLTKADLEKRIDDFKADLVNEHFPEVEEVKCIELISCLKEVLGKLVLTTENVTHYEKAEIIYKGKYFDSVMCIDEDGNKTVFLGKWNSGIDEIGRDWNK